MTKSICGDKINVMNFINNKDSRVAAIIPAYNEEITIAKVISTIKASPLISEVIVVSDGSIDKTADQARKAGADKVYELSPNRGKGAAVIYGVKQTTAPIVAFFDADLIGLNVKHIEMLATQVINKKLEMCVGLRDRGKFGTWLTKYLPYIYHLLRGNEFFDGI